MDCPEQTCYPEALPLREIRKEQRRLAALLQRHDLDVYVPKVGISVRGCVYVCTRARDLAKVSVCFSLSIRSYTCKQSHVNYVNLPIRLSNSVNKALQMFHPLAKRVALFI